MIIVLAIDGLEHNLVQEFCCTNLMQKKHGKTDISDFEEPRTMVLWSSFLSGVNKEKEIVAKGPKEMWNTRLQLNETFLAQFKNPIVIDLPGYSYDLAHHENERKLLKGFFEKKVTVEEYDRPAFAHHRKIKDEFFSALKQNHDIVIGYFSLADVVGHLSLGNKAKMRMIYKEMDDIASEVKKKFRCPILILSDHGMKPVGMFGDHSGYGFWSFSSDTELENPKITDFRGFINGLKDKT